MDIVGLGLRVQDIAHLHWLTSKYNVLQPRALFLSSYVTRHTALLCDLFAVDSGASIRFFVGCMIADITLIKSILKFGICADICADKVPFLSKL